MIRHLVIVMLAAVAVVAVGCRPKGEVVRYMARPPAKVVNAPQDGTYLLYPGINDPAILVEDLQAGDPIGFNLVENPQGGRWLVAVVGEDQSLRLDRGERYAWMLQGAMDQSIKPDGVSSPADLDQQRLKAARRAYEQARAELDRAQENHAAAERRLQEAQKAAESN